MATALAYWRELAAAMDDIGSYQIALATISTVIIQALASAETGASANAYDGRWIFAPEFGGQQRRIRRGSYEPAFSATHGRVSVDPTWSAPTADTQVEITGLFPMVQGLFGAGEDTSYRTLVNRALALIQIPRRVDVAVTDDSTPLSLPWLDREERLDTSDGEGWLLEPSPVTGRRAKPCMWRGPKLVVSGQTSALELKAPLTATLTLKTLSPGNTWIATSGTWAETSPSSGLLNASDEAMPTIEEVVTVGKMLAYQALMGRSPGRPSGNWADKYADAREQAMKLARFDHTLYAAAAPAAEGAA